MVFCARKMHISIKYNCELTRNKYCYHILKAIENLCEKENNGPKGVIVERKLV